MEMAMYSGLIRKTSLPYVLGRDDRKSAIKFRKNIEESQYWPFSLSRRDNLSEKKLRTPKMKLRLNRRRTPNCGRARADASRRPYCTPGC